MDSFFFLIHNHIQILCNFTTVTINTNATNAIYGLNYNLLGITFNNITDNGPIYTRDGSSVWDELGQRTVVRLIIRLCINTGFQTDHPSRRTTVDDSSGRMIRLKARIYTQMTDYKTNYRSLPKFVPDG